MLGGLPVDDRRARFSESNLARADKAAKFDLHAILSRGF
jgi:hypothetical protein